MRIDWVKRPTYEEIVRDLEKDYTVKLPGRAALNSYGFIVHAHFKATQHQIRMSQQNVDDARATQ